jgi:hypothetical protein
VDFSLAYRTIPEPHQAGKKAIMKNRQKQMMLSMGQFLGEAVLHAVRGMEHALTSGRIFRSQKTVSFPVRAG